MSFFYHFLLFFYWTFEFDILSFFSYFIGIALWGGGLGGGVGFMN